MSRGGKLNFSLSREFFDRTFGDKTWVSKQTLRVPCHRVFRHNFRPKADSYDPKTGIRKTGQEVVFQLDQSGVAARPCVTKSQNHET